MRSKCVSIPYAALTCRRKWLSFSQFRYFFRGYGSTSESSSEKISSFQYKISNSDRNDEVMEQRTPIDEHYNRECPPVSLFAKMMMQSSKQLPSTKLASSKTELPDENQKIRSMTKRLQSMTDKSDTTITTIQNLMADDDLYSKSFKSEIEIENSIEVLAFGNDFEGLKSTSPLHGTEDPSVESSNVPCTGCGAMLQCNNKIIPGFMVSEHFKMMSRRELERSICQRCYYMRHGNAFVEVKADPKEYEEMISKIKPTRSIVVMVVDLMDIQGSIVPQLSRYIGHRKQVVVVGNKADLLTPDGPDYLKNAKTQLKAACEAAGLKSVKEYRLISAKTGYGVENLITTLFGFYKLQVDVYIVGTANSGKSSLFNILLGSDYCRQTARDLIQRATVSQWPGTTLNLLKFPIMKFNQKHEAIRHYRLKQENAMRKEAERLAFEEAHDLGIVPETWELKTDVRTSDSRTNKQIQADDRAQPWGQQVVSFTGRSDGGFSEVNEREDKLKMAEMPSSWSAGYWVYDTPGIINPNQLINILSPNSCTAVTPTSMVVPRCVMVRPGNTVFVSGLARIDCIETQSDDVVYLTIHSSAALPVRVGQTDEAEEYYEQHLGTQELMVPSEKSDLPSLSSKEFVVTGRGGREAAADIQLSSVGFVSVTARRDIDVTLRAYTPGGVGLAVREALMPHFYHFRGRRIPGTPFYQTKPAGSVLAGRPGGLSVED